MALGFGPTAMEAGQHALITSARRLRRDAGGVRQSLARRGTRGSRTACRRQHRTRLYHVSAAVLRAHESKRVEGGIIASLSIPWGFSKPDDDLGGYHLVWPETSSRSPAASSRSARTSTSGACLRYLQVTQEADGHWSQNMWLDGTPYWHGMQMDETALPILLVDLAAREGVIDTGRRDALWPMVRRAAAFLARNGPVSPQDRWEEEPGYAPFTVATEIAALLVAADLADAASNTDGRRVSAGDSRRMERQHRAMAVCVGNGVGAAARRRRATTCAWRSPIRPSCFAVPGIRPDQEPASG